ncbi:MAG: hypothetical protein U1F77_09245 [Kiritimatiellia bacterium]
MIARPSADPAAALAAYPRPLRGPYGTMARCIAGEMPTDSLLGQLSHMPESFHNDALFAVALREMRAGHADRARDALVRMRKLSSPRSDWPASAAALPFFHPAPAVKP